MSVDRPVTHIPSCGGLVPSRTTARDVYGNRDLWPNLMLELYIRLKKFGHQNLGPIVTNPRFYVNRVNVMVDPKHVLVASELGFIVSNEINGNDGQNQWCYRQVDMQKLRKYLVKHKKLSA